MKLPACTGSLKKVLRKIKRVCLRFLGRRSELRYSKNFLQFFGVMMISAGVVVGTYITLNDWIIPQIRALSETTKTMPADFSFAAIGYDTGSGTTYAISSEVRLATSSSWFNGAFTKKKDLTITNFSGYTATAGGTMTITVDTKSLFDAGKLLTTGDDLRVVYSTQSGTFVELPRSLMAAAGTTINTSTATQVSFPLQTTLLSASSSASYALYYGNANAVAPSFPKEKYLSFDGSNDLVTTPLHFSTWPSKTFAAWVYLGANKNWDPIILDAAAYDSNKYSGLLARNSQLDFFQSYGPSATIDVHETGNSLAVGSGWVHVAATIDKPTGVVRLFVNGQKIKETTIDMSGMTFLDTLSTAKIGGNGNATFMNGGIDEEVVYNRALSEAEISSVYQGNINTSDSSLKLYYKFNEGSGQTVTDYSGNGNNGTLGANSSVATDDPTWSGGFSKAYSLGSKNATLVCPFNGTTTCVGGATPNTVSGAIRYATGSAMLFDGVNDEINTSTFGKLPTGTSARTINFWFKPGPGMTDLNGALGYGGGAWNGSVVGAWANQNSIGIHGGTCQVTGITTSISGNSWHMYSAVFNGDNTITFYLDGGSQVTRTPPGGCTLNTGTTNNLSIGKHAWGRYNGKLDEVAIYNRALSSSEISTLYNGANPAPIIADNTVVALYHFDENGDDPRNTGKIIDSSGNGINGTIDGAKYVNDSPIKNGSFASHEGVFVEEGTTNLAVNPSFEANITDGWAGKSGFNYTTAQVDADGNALLGSNNIKDVFFYDTTKDSDGGAWRNNATAKASSWYNENFSTTRGKKREFPEKAWIVGTDIGMDIIDATENKLWMRFNKVYVGGYAGTLINGGESCTTRSDFALNGRIYVTSNGGSGSSLTQVDFKANTGYLTTDSTANRRFRYTDIAQRNATGQGATDATIPYLVNKAANDVSAALINGKTYVAVATGIGYNTGVTQGVSVINETDGTVANSTFETDDGPKAVWLTPHGALYWNRGSDSNGILRVKYNIQNYSSSFGADASYYGALSSSSSVKLRNGPIYSGGIFVTDGTSTVDGTSNTIYISQQDTNSNGGLTVIQEKQGAETHGSVKYYTKDMISEEMVGDIRGMWDFSRNATLVDGNTVLDASPRGTDLTSVNGATVVNGVRGNGFQFNGSTQYLKQKTYLTDSGSTWGSSTQAMSLATGSAFFRAGETLGSELKNNPGLETAGAGGADIWSWWSETAGGGAIADETVLVHNGSHAAKLSYGAGGSTELESSITVTPGNVYNVTFWTRGDGANAGTYGFRDATNGYAAIVPLGTTTGVAGTNYQQVSAVFIAPAGCVSVDIDFRPASVSGAVTYYDDISFKQVTSPKISTYAGADSGSTPYMLVASDSASRKAWGYIGAPSSGQSLGSELMTNGTFATDSNSDGLSDNWSMGGGYDSTQSIVTGNGFSGNAQRVSGGSGTNKDMLFQTFSSTIGKLYKLTFFYRSSTTLMLNSSSWTWAGGSGRTVPTNTGNAVFATVYFTAPMSAGNSISFRTNAAGAWYEVSNVSIKEVTDTQIDGVHILTTRNGASKGWTAFDSLFNFNDTAYTFEVRKSDFQITGDFTIGAWVNFTSVYAWENSIMEKGGMANSTTDKSWFLYTTGPSSTNALNFGISGNGIGSGTVSTPFIPTTGQWYYLTAVKTGTTGKIYINGVPANSGTLSTPFDGPGVVKIGTTESGFPYSGKIDEPFVAAEAYTDAQILDMYNKGLGALNHATKTDQKLAGTSNTVNSVWASPDTTQIYVGTGGTGAVSVIKNGKVGNYTDSDSLLTSFTTSTTPALVSNDSFALAIASPSATTPQMIIGSTAGGVSVLNNVLGAATRNTTVPYYKFGTASLKLDNSTSYLDTPYTFTATLTNASYNLSAYLYKDGTQVASSDAVLITDDQPSTGSATYTDMGGGWTRVSANFTGQAKAGRFGIQVKPTKIIYTDGVQLEQTVNPTTYCDGSMGTGYTWSGTVNNSNSVRTEANMTYPTSVLNTNTGTISLWYKADNWVSNRTLLFHYSGTGNRIYIRTTANGGMQLVLGDSTITSTATCVVGQWCHIVGTWNNGSGTIYINNVGLTSAYVNLSSFGSTFAIGGAGGYTPSGGTISDLRIYDQPLTGPEVTNMYYGGLQTHSSSNERVDRYVSSGTYTSAPLDLGANGQWGMTPIAFNNVNNGGTVSYETRSSADGSSWGAWQAISGSNVQSDPRRYLEWRATINSIADMSDSPVINGMTVKYIEDTTAPVNPQTAALGFSTTSTPSADIISNVWADFATPKFTWDAGVDTAANGQSSSGIEGYMTLLTKTADASPSASMASTCYKYALEGQRSFTVGSSPATCALTDGIWYLRVQTKDFSGNVSDPVTLFTYKYDGSIPNAPISIASTSVGYSANNTFGFYWPAGTDNGPSGVLGYEYKTGISDGSTFSDWQFTSATSVNNIPAYKEGQNFIYVRTVDVAGNVSGVTSNNLTVASFYYNASAPSAPVNIAISPNTTEDSQAESNVFDVTWDKPASFSGEIAKYYYCVNCTPSEYNMTETTPSETVSRTLTNVALATQQGKNTLYILAEDNNMNTTTGHGNRSFQAYATADFFAKTIAPSAPTNLSLNDASDRDASLWRLSLTWKTATDGGEVAKYQIYRSIDNVAFTKLGETTSTAYTDADLLQSQKYFYKVLAMDNAGSPSLFSTTVYRSPEGKYTTPPTIGGVPVVTPGSSTAIVRWSTGRIAYGTVEYGKTDGYGSGSTETVMTKDHAVKITGLAPGMTYHFRTQSLDDSAMTDYDRTAAYSGDYTFSTLNSAQISNVTIEEVTLNTAVISWMTSSLSTSTVEYGETTNYGMTEDVSTSASESSHIARLTNLKHSTDYNFRVRGITSDGDDIFSENYILSTLKFPKVTAVVLNTDQGAGGASVVLAWATNVLTTGEVEYQALKPEGNISLPELQNMSQTSLASVSAAPVGKALIAYSGEMVDKHLMRMDNLQDGMIYVFTIRGRDTYGNQAISDPIRYVTGLDTRPPVISNIVIETPMLASGADVKAQAIISWETDEPAIGQILWGTGTGSEYGNKSETDAMPTTKHTIVLRDLQPTTSYHLKIESTDASGNLASSQDSVVVTPTSQQAALDIVLKNLEDVFGFLKL